MAGFLNFGFGGEGQKVPKLGNFLVRRVRKGGRGGGEYNFYCVLGLGWGSGSFKLGVLRRTP